MVFAASIFRLFLTGLGYTLNSPISFSTKPSVCPIILIVAAIKTATNETVDRHKIKMDKHIKKAGKYTVKITLESQVVANVSISVVSDK